MTAAAAAATPAAYPKRLIEVDGCQRLSIHRVPANPSASDIRRLSSRTSRLLRLLRAHGVIRKIPKTHRYRLTHKGVLLTTALCAARSANIKQLLAVAA